MHMMKMICYIASGGTAGYCAIAKLPDSKYDLRYIQAWLNHPYTEKYFKLWEVILKVDL